MNAIVCYNYGSSEVLKYEQIPNPIAQAKQVLVRVRAAAVNPLDWHMMRGMPYIARLGGMGKTKPMRLGVDLAGQVEAVGTNVTQFKPGDKVFGTCMGSGAFAEYVCTFETSLTVKPEHLTFEQAAAVPVAAFTALQALRDKAQVQAGQKVLINGAAGGVGTFAVQIAKSLGADVTGVCSTRNMDLVRSLGADRVLDYTQEDFTKGAQRYDAVLDCVGNHSLSAYRRVLSPKGSCIVVTGPDGRWLGPLGRFIQALALAPFVSQKLIPFLAKINQQDLTFLCSLIENGKLMPVIDRRYALNDVPEAVRYVEHGHARGKVVITVNSD